MPRPKRWQAWWKAGAKTRWSACSIWTVDPTLTRTLLVYHNIYDSWSWIGGHADGERDLAAVALRELAEETGVEHAQLVDCGIYSLEVLTVDGHVKRGSSQP